MKNKLKTIVIPFFIKAVIFGGIMFVFYYFVDKTPLNKSLSKAATVAVLFSIINLIADVLLNKKKTT